MKGGDAPDGNDDPDDSAGLVLPIQYYGALRRARVSSGEQRLMLALLADAIRNLLTTGPQYRRVRNETREWIAGRPATVSFEDACESVGLDPDALRLRLMVLAAGDPRLHLGVRKHLRIVESGRPRGVSSSA